MIFTTNDRLPIQDQFNLLLDQLNMLLSGYGNDGSDIYYGNDKIMPADYDIQILDDLDESAYPIGSVFITTTNTDPGDTLGGTWELYDKEFKGAWITDAFTFNNTNTQDSGDNMRLCVAVLSGHTIELRWRWYNKVALSDTTTTIGTLDKSKIGLTGSHDVYPIAYCDGLGAIGMGQLTTGSDTANLNIVDWVTRATEYPSTTRSDCRCSHTLTIQTPSAMIDSFCDKFYWRRTG